MLDINRKHAEVGRKRAEVPEVDREPKEVLDVEGKLGRHWDSMGRAGRQ